LIIITDARLDAAALALLLIPVFMYVRTYAAVHPFFMFDQVVFASEAVTVSFAFDESTEELGGIVFLAVVALEAAFVGEGFLLAGADGACEGPRVPILMPPKKRH
jgi:hypothetical protein